MLLFRHGLALGLMRVWSVRTLTSALRARPLASSVLLFLLHPSPPRPAPIRRLPPLSRRALRTCARRPRSPPLEARTHSRPRRRLLSTSVRAFTVARPLPRLLATRHAGRSPVVWASSPTPTWRMGRGFLPARHRTPLGPARLRVLQRPTICAALHSSPLRSPRNNSRLRPHRLPLPSSRSLVRRHSAGVPSRSASRCLTWLRPMDTTLFVGSPIVS